MAILPMVRWVLIDADWVGSTREACGREGAGGVFVGSLPLGIVLALGSSISGIVNSACSIRGVIVVTALLVTG